MSHWDVPFIPDRETNEKLLLSKVDNICLFYFFCKKVGIRKNIATNLQLIPFSGSLYRTLQTPTIILVPLKQPSLP